jgi:catechol 2,3-dioxygenase-like lactoylglutathione lyase family enzyme
MTFLNGIHHVAILTPDLDRLVMFYETVFCAPVAREVTEMSRRLAAVELGVGRLLEAAQLPDTEPSPVDRPMSQRGPLDHFALAARSQEAFLEARRRLIQAGAANESVRDYGPFWSLRFHDPDGVNVELVWNKPGGHRLAIRSPGEATLIDVSRHARLGPQRS